MINFNLFYSLQELHFSPARLLIRETFFSYMLFFFLAPGIKTKTYFCFLLGLIFLLTSTSPGLVKSVSFHIFPGKSLRTLLMPWPLTLAATGQYKSVDRMVSICTFFIDSINQSNLVN